jgi:hypothetical protein
MGNSESVLAKQALNSGALPLKILSRLLNNNSASYIPSSDRRIDLYVSCPKTARPPASDLADIIDSFCMTQNLPWTGDNAVTFWFAGICDEENNCARDRKNISELIEASRYVLFIPPLGPITTEDRELCIFELNCARQASVSLHMRMHSIERLGQALHCTDNELVDFFLPRLSDSGYSCRVAEKAKCEYESDEPESVCCGWADPFADTTAAPVVLQNDAWAHGNVAALLRSLSLKTEMTLSIDKTASLAEKSGALDQARRLRQQAHSTLEELLGTHHPSTLVSLRELCLVLLKLKRYDESVEQLGRCLRGYEEVFGDTHIRTLCVVRDLALALRRSGELQRAKPMYERAMNGDSEFGKKLNLIYIYQKSL